MDIVILCCHGIFAPEGNFISDPRYEKTADPKSVAVYFSHIVKAAEMLQEEPEDSRILIISGGSTKPQTELSEAESYLNIMRYLLTSEQGKKVLLEEYARDNLENLLFSMCRVYQTSRVWPSTVKVISWMWKKERIRLIAEALRLPSFEFIGVGDKENLKTPTEIAQEIAGDPLHRLPELEIKRVERNPWRKNIPYGDIPDLGTTFNVLNEMEKERNPSLPRGFKFPWEI